MRNSTLSDQVTFNLDAAGYDTDIIILDFAKAFDKVNNIPVHKLEHYEFTAQINKWIESFLTDRKQAVLVEGNKSELTPVRSEVPQGSVLGPCLFLAYVNDRIFADDSVLYRVRMIAKGQV